MKDKGYAELFAVPLLLAYFDSALVGDGELQGSPWLLLCSSGAKAWTVKLFG